MTTTTHSTLLCLSSLSQKPRWPIHLPTGSIPRNALVTLLSCAQLRSAHLRVYPTPFKTPIHPSSPTWILSPSFEERRGRSCATNAAVPRHPFGNINTYTEQVSSHLGRIPMHIPLVSALLLLSPFDVLHTLSTQLFCALLVPTAFFSSS
ncbi:hypothetical protein DFH09DRAFT_1272298, partial [Mycena vulgaris]